MYGLMVWQEMIFACALYPRDESFLALVDAEVRQQVRRLATHTSIVIWGGNNENEAALNWYEPSRGQRDLYLTDYVKLYVDTVMPAIRATDYDRRPAVDTSPSNGLLSVDPYVKRWGVTSTKAKASAGSWGDIHYYNYEADCEDASTYPLARFVSEHGFQSFPSMDVYDKVTDQIDWSRESRFSEFRMRHPDGNAQELAMISRHFRVPPANCTPPAAGQPAHCEQRRLFASYLYLTQLQQARCYETAFTHWRRHRSTNANTMGILYWQLNSIWQGPDWSTIEYDGRLRLAHHASRRAFAPLLLSAVRSVSARGIADSGGTPDTVQGTGGATDAPHVIDIHLSNDLPYEIEGDLRVELYRWGDAPARPVAHAERPAAVGAASSHLVWRDLDLATLLAQQQPGTMPSAIFARLSFAPRESMPADDRLKPSQVKPGMVTSGEVNSGQVNSGQVKSGQVKSGPTNDEGGGTPSIAMAWHWLAPFRDVDLPAATPRVLSVTQLSATSAIVRLSSDATAAFVSVECSAVVGAFSDAGFLLLAGDAPTSIWFVAQEPFEKKAFETALRVTSLRDTYPVS